jgi:hypothetical protein
MKACEGTFLFNHPGKRSATRGVSIGKTWMPGTRLGMTAKKVTCHVHGL